MLAKFEVYFDGEYWCARGIGADVFTQGRTLDADWLTNLTIRQVAHSLKLWYDLSTNL